MDPNICIPTNTYHLSKTYAWYPEVHRNNKVNSSLQRDFLLKIPYKDVCRDIYIVTACYVLYYDTYMYSCQICCWLELVIFLSCMIYYNYDPALSYQTAVNR